MLHVNDISSHRFTSMGTDSLIDTRVCGRKYVISTTGKVIRKLHLRTSIDRNMIHLGNKYTVA